VVSVASAKWCDLLGGFGGVVGVRRRASVSQQMNQSSPSNPIEIAEKWDAAPSQTSPRDDWLQRGSGESPY